MQNILGENALPIEILLVEDSPGDVLLTREALRDAKIRLNLQIASDGEEAMALLRRDGKYAAAPRPPVSRPPPPHDRDTRLRCAGGVDSRSR